MRATSVESKASRVRGDWDNAHPRHGRRRHHNNSCRARGQYRRLGYCLVPDSMPAQRCPRTNNLATLELDASLEGPPRGLVASAHRLIALGANPPAAVGEPQAIEGSTA